MNALNPNTHWRIWLVSNHSEQFSLEIIGGLKIIRRNHDIVSEKTNCCWICWMSFFNAVNATNKSHSPASNWAGCRNQRQISQYLCYDQTTWHSYLWTYCGRIGRKTWQATRWTLTNHSLPSFTSYVMCIRKEVTGTHWWEEAKKLRGSSSTVTHHTG